MYKAKELRDKSIEEIDVLYEELCQKLFQLTNEKTEAKKLDNPASLGACRKDIARLLTVKREKQNEETK